MDCYFRILPFLCQFSEDEKVLPELLTSLLNVDPHCLDNDCDDDSTDDLPENIVLPAENFLLKVFQNSKLLKGSPLETAMVPL
jgi:hypothetical protein